MNPAKLMNCLAIVTRALGAQNVGDLQAFPPDACGNVKMTISSEVSHVGEQGNAQTKLSHAFLAIRNRCSGSSASRVLFWT